MRDSSSAASGTIINAFALRPFSSADRPWAFFHLPITMPLGGAVGGVALGDDSTDRIEADGEILGDAAQRTAALVQLQHLGDLGLAGEQRAADRLGAAIDQRQVPVPAPHKVVVVVHQLVVLVPPRLPRPSAVVGHLHLEGFAPLLDEAVAVLDLVLHAPDHVALGVDIAAQLLDEMPGSNRAAAA